MDFIKGLPKVGGKSLILTMEDRFSKYVHFIPLAHPYSVETVARMFLMEVVFLDGMPIMPDRDLVFSSSF